MGLFIYDVDRVLGRVTQKEETYTTSSRTMLTFSPRCYIISWCAGYYFWNGYAEVLESLVYTN